MYLQKKLLIVTPRYHICQYTARRFDRPGPGLIVNALGAGIPTPPGSKGATPLLNCVNYSAYIIP